MKNIKMDIVDMGINKTKNMPKIFITGGISSGKSGFAEDTAVSIYKTISMQTGHPLHFIATAKFNGESCNGENISAATDEEMALKIKKHKDKRNASFAVHENFEDLKEEIKGIFESLGGGEGVILIDSMTLWLSSIFKSLSDYDFALETILKFSKYLAEIKCSVITVADSLGFNMVPVDAYVRKFIELNGLMEQELSALSDKAYCIIAGNPLSLK
ncbi:MAG: bifunctional adenosylcobinamide kinase/adenosylcobinamide-phosphate guanylyltransferase [bacterium]